MAKVRIAYGLALKLTPLKDHLIKQGLIDKIADWKELSGGLTDKVYKVAQNKYTKVCVKL